MTEELAQIRSITSTALLADFAVGRGIPLSTVLRGTGIRENTLHDPSTEITIGQEFSLMHNVVEAVDDEPGMGLLAGLLCHPPSLGVLGFALMCSSNLRHAMDIALRYADLSFTAAHHYLEDHGSEVWVLRDDAMLPPEIRRFALERDLAAIATIQQDLIPIRIPAVHVQLYVDAHPIYEMFGAVFGVEEVVFSVPQSRMAFQATALETPLPQANMSTARFYEQQCADLMESRHSRSGLSGRVRQLLIRHGGSADQARIAADLDVSVRTLRRRLAEEGTTFRELSLETVGMLAEELLIAGLTVEQAADRLGYASVSAFASAFRTWKGQSPGHFGRLHRGRAPVRTR
ncbi:AraC family transcriptional regulator [Nocardia yunnanensis]|uniref:AraC family transcriptional regulator n=1 Tax=Nocardia yunnanensis TaxID=2382165 RepID=A0A386ZJW7_9NOCA|nr:AraC family transcriptional regulator [Nocardia yunnanensis]AYF76919.1 AraC family transcriptional regulator [Nocardia yunnanensis]